MATAFRHEYKYLAPETTLAALQQRVQSVLTLDAHVGARGSYGIRSLYFDDLYNTCYRENVNGTDPREKFRIRIYNGSTEKITLELKQKVKGMTRKYATPLSYERCCALMNGELLTVRDEDAPLYKKFYAQVRSRNLHPVTIVSYERVPYIWREGNVRVTFDRHIGSSEDFRRFFDDDLPERPVLPLYQNLLEVKFDEFLPDFLYELLQVGSLAQTTFSKYYVCRTYAMSGMVPVI